VPVFADTGVLLTPHSDMQIRHNVSDKKAITLSDALTRMEIVSPQVKEQQAKLNQYLIKAEFNPDEFATPLTWTVTPYEVPAMMALEELRKITLGRFEKASIKLLNQAYALLEWDNLQLVKLNAKNDLKKLYIGLVINDDYIDVLESNKDFFSSAYQDAVQLEANHLILPSDLLKIQNYRNQIQRELDSRKIKKNVYQQDLGQLIDENKFVLTTDGAVIDTPYSFDLTQIPSVVENHPDHRKSHDALAIYRSDKLYRLISQRVSLTSVISITIRRVVFEGPFLMVAHPSSETLINLFRDVNYKQKKELRAAQIDEAEQEIKASEQGLAAKIRNGYYQVQQDYNNLQDGKDNLEFNKRNFFEKQKLYEANNLSLMDLVQAKVDLYQSELNYLQLLESYNNSVSDLQFLSGQYEDGQTIKDPKFS
jgi:hypothetical protein